MPGPSGTYEFRFFSNNGFTKLTTNASVTVSGGASALTVNGSSSPITVAAGSTVTVGVQNGPSNPTDWVGLYQTGAADTSFLNWFYLNGSKSAPTAGMTTATVPFVMSGSSGTYEFRFFQNNGYTKLATSPAVTVTGSASTLTANGSSLAISVAAGSTVTVGVQNGPRNPTDWVGLYPTGAADTSFLNWFYLNGAKSAPAVGITTATILFVMPGSSGTYEFRFFQNNGYTKLATSPTVTVQSTGGPNLTVNGSSTGITVARGVTVNVGVQNGPGTTEDCVGLYPTSAGLFDPSITIMYVTGTTATLPFTTPSTPGPYEFRFFQHCANAQKLATSPTVTIQ
jgi:hypothetical protein